MRYPSTGFLHKSGDMGSGPKNVKNLLLGSFILIFYQLIFWRFGQYTKNLKLRQKRCFQVASISPSIGQSSFIEFLLFTLFKIGFCYVLIITFKCTKRERLKNFLCTRLMRLKVLNILQPSRLNIFKRTSLAR